MGSGQAMSGIGSSALRLILQSLVGALAAHSLAASQCPGAARVISQDSSLSYRLDLIRRLRESGAAAGLRVHPDGTEIPIVLLNKDTMHNPVVADLVADTMAISMDVGWNPGSPDIDHGFLRLSNDRLVDYGGHGARVDKDAAGKVRYGSRELNDTGLVHRAVLEYLDKYRKPNSPVMIELAYLATPEQIETARAFHNMRRAGVIRNVMESAVRYDAGGVPGNVNPWIRDRPRTMVGLEFAENCVSYCTGATLNNQIGFMKWKIGEMGINSDAILNDPANDFFFASAQKILADVDWRNPDAIHPHMLDRPELRSALPHWVRDKGLGEAQQNDLTAYLVGARLSGKYRQIIEEQGSQNVVGDDLNPWDHRPRAYSNKRPEFDSSNPRAVAVIVYSDWKDASQLIREGRFEYRGRAHGIFRTENSPAGLTQKPLPGGR